MARRLVATGRLIDTAPDEALAHAVAARRLASRVSAVREAVGLAAYHAGEWQTAISELRTYHRMSGQQTHLAVLADCERALGRPTRAIDLYRTAPAGSLSPAEATELLIVAAGARADLGQHDAAVAMLQVPELSAEEPSLPVARLRYAYADTLLTAGRRVEAREWFARAATVDEHTETDAAQRLLELDGVVIDEVEPDQDDSDPEAELPIGAEVPADTEISADAETRPISADAEIRGDVDTGVSTDGETPVEAEPETLAEPETPGAEEEPVEEAGEPALAATDRLVDAYDLVILDLDGVVYLGAEPIPAAAEAVARLRQEGKPVVFATNNASRSPEQVAALLSGLGIAAAAGDVLTSAAVAAEVLADRLPPGSTVLVVGTDALADQVRGAGLEPVSRADDKPAAVVQGYGPEVGWAALAEAQVAIRAGASWVVTNPDTTQPSRRGLLPGNGALVAALRTALEREPDLVLGKPEPTLFTAAARRFGAVAPLVVGDRLDTDIEGAHRAGMASLLVLTGVDGRAQADHAPAQRRPTFLGADLGALFAPAVRP